MTWMFESCGAFNGDISKWNTSNVQYMKNMFSYCSEVPRSQIVAPIAEAGMFYPREGTDGMRRVLKFMLPKMSKADLQLIPVDDLLSSDSLFKPGDHDDAPDHWLATIAAKFGMKFVETTEKTGKLLIFGVLNHEVFPDSTNHGNWNTVVSTCSDRNYLWSSDISDTTSDYDHLAFGADGWLDKYNFLTKFHKMLRLVPINPDSPPSITKKKRGRPSKKSKDVEKKRGKQSKKSKCSEKKRGRPSKKSKCSEKKRGRSKDVKSPLSPDKPESPDKPKSPMFYDVDDISNRDTKKKANQLFAESVTSVCLSMASGRVVYLDAQDCNTTSFIDDRIKKKHEITILNHDNTVIETMVVQKLVKGIGVQETSVHEWATKAMKHSVVACWLDYCCTLHGTVKSSPFHDISLLIFHQVFRVGGVLAITICTRDATSKSIEVPDKILGLLLGNYPAAKITCRYAYRPSMLYFSFQL